MDSADIPIKNRLKQKVLSHLLVVDDMTAHGIISDKDWPPLIDCFNNKTLMKKIFKPLASLKLAVVVILSIGLLTAIGTFVEAKYDAYAAKKLVYDTVWMYGIMGFLAINLIAVMVDRLPWKRRHISFIFAHIGILMILAGSVLTMQYGLDGSMRVGIGEENNMVQVANTDLVVYSSFDGDRYSKVLEKEVDFFLQPPTEKNPLTIPAFEGEIKIVDYAKYVVPSRRVVASESTKTGAGLRFQVQNSNVNEVQWLVQRKPNQLAVQNFGPAQVYLGITPPKGSGANEIYLTPQGKDQLKYTVFHKDSEKPFKTGVVKEGGSFEPGWMGIQFRVLRYLPHAMEDWDLQPLEHPTPLTTSAVKVVFNGKEQWLLMNDMLKLFTDKGVYLLTYANRRIDIGFPLRLKEFTVDRYQGTTRAMAYKSQVAVPDFGETEISMNEPLKWKGLTFYQASFQEENGKPVASVFSVNQDPGRFLKYLGSLVMTLGIIFLFYFKRMDFLALKKKEQSK